jgi:hypothetical protein
MIASKKNDQHARISEIRQGITFPVRRGQAEIGRSRTKR